MKIGVVCRFPPEKDGIAFTYLNLVNELEKHIGLIKIGTKNSSAHYKLNFKSFSLKNELEKIVKSEKLDLLHIHYIAPYYGRYTLNLNLISALSQNVPVIVTLHEVQYSCNGLKNKILCFIEKEIVKNADIITVHTEQQKNFLISKYKTKKVECIYMGVTPRETQKTRGKNILFFGILSKLKGLEYLIDAMEELKDFKLKIVVSMPNNQLLEYRNSLIKRINSKNLANIELVSKEWYSNQEKALYYGWANMMVLPYIWGTYQSAVVVDAVAYGLPVVITGVGAIWEMVSQFNCGVVIKPRMSKEISRGAKKIFYDYKKYSQGIAKYRKSANWEDIAKKYLELFEQSIFYKN